MTHFMFGLSLDAPPASEEMIREILLNRFPGCTFACDDARAIPLEDWILPIAIEPHPTHSERVLPVSPDRTLVIDVIEEFRKALLGISRWKAS
jgi:hypothetical protein